jgi:putative pyoverdin transport system ATP-binding/permease protein
MNLLRFLLRASWGVVALAVLAGIGSGLCGVGLIALINAELGAHRPASHVLAWSFVGLCVTAAGTRVIAQAAMVRLAQGSISRLVAHLCRRTLALPLRQFEEVDPASLLAVLTDDTIVLSNALIGIPLICINGPIVVACLAYVGWLSPMVLLCALGVAVPALVGYEVLASLGMRRLKLGREGQDALVAHFRTLTSGFRELKLHSPRREAYLRDGVECASASVRDHNTAGLTLFALAGSWGQAAFFGYIGLLLFVLPQLPGIGRESLTGAVLVTLYIMSPLDVIVTWIPVLGRARISLNKIEQLGVTLKARDAENSPLLAARPGEFESIRLADIEYTYMHGNEREFTLGPIDLELNAGELVFLVGGNGSGKTTLVKLLAGLYTPERGSVQCDGERVVSARLEDYRQLFSVVYADGHLFDGLMGLDRAGLDESAHEELARLELGEKVRVVEGRFSTTDLSLGQRKRLALLTLLLEDRPICVFDEWAANQDPRFKRVFYLEILPELRAKGKAILVITHDEDYFPFADRVLKLEGGRLMDSDGRDLRSAGARSEARP